MVVRSNPSAHCGWESIVTPINPDTGKMTCVGYASTRHRRCRNAIRIESRATAMAWLQAMGGAGLQVSFFLRMIAANMLCGCHTLQIEGIIGQWEEKFADANKRANEREAADEEEVKQFERQRRPYASPKPSKSSGSYYHQGTGQRSKEQQSKYEPRSSFKTEEFPRSEQARESAQDTRPRPSTTYDPSPEERRRKAKQEWENSWAKYVSGWTAVESDPTDRDVKIPWPTKSGLLRDVSEAAVREFYSRAPPEEHRSSEARFRFMTAESKKWHTDKILGRFGEGVREGEHKRALDVTACVVIDLWKQSKLQRSKI